MGLDIRTPVTWDRLRDEIDNQLSYLAVGSDENVRMQADRSHVDRIAESMRGADVLIHTRPGSYHGLHRVRCLYATLKGWSVTTAGHVLFERPCAAEASHLINHSDCDGYYVPSKFDPPNYLDGVSIGSSLSLLAELREIESVSKDENQQWAWDAVYVAALASCLCREAIHFE